MKRPGALLADASRLGFFTSALAGLVGLVGLAGLACVSGCYDFDLLSTASDGGSAATSDLGRSDGKIGGGGDLVVESSTSDLRNRDLGGADQAHLTDGNTDVGSPASSDLRVAVAVDSSSPTDLAGPADLSTVVVGAFDLLGVDDLASDSAVDLSGRDLGSVVSDDLHGSVDLRATVESDLAGADLVTATTASDLSLAADFALAADLKMSPVPDLATSPDLAHGIVPPPTGIFPSLISRIGTRGVSGYLAAADFDVDGRTDLIAGTDTNTIGALYLAAPAGGLKAPIDVLTNVGARTFGAGDFFRDGKPDLIAGDPGMVLVSAQSVDVLTNLGGYFDTPSTRGVDPVPAFFVTGDFDGDGHIDAVVGGSDSLEVLLGDGTGNLVAGPKLPGVGFSMTSLVAGDLDGDGLLDLAFSDPMATPGGVVVLLNSGNAMFVTQATVVAPSEAVAIADLDGDGKNDLLSAGTTVNVFLNQGGAAWTPLFGFPGTDGALYLATADFDGDGMLDFALGATDDTSIYHGNGDGTFARLGPLYATSMASGLVAGDYNGDGKMDLAVADPAVGVSLLINLGQGLFFGAAHVRADPLPLSYTTVQPMGVGDFNGDGQLDLCGARLGGEFEVMLRQTDGSYAAPISTTVGYDGDTVATGLLDAGAVVDAVYVGLSTNKVTVLLGSGDGSMTKGATYANAGHPAAPLLVDLSGDGKIDLLVANESSNNCSLYLGNGDGTFQAATTHAVHTFPYATAAADLNSDGKINLLVANVSSNDVSVLLGTGGGAFAAAKNYAATASTAPTSVAYGDFNGDGKLDVVVASCSDGVDLYLGDGNGALGTPKAIAVPGCAESVAVADYDHDGKLDLAVLRQTDKQIDLLLGHGDGTFSDVASYYGAQTGAGLVGADVNADGKPDLVAADGQNAVVLVNQAP